MILNPRCGFKPDKHVYRFMKRIHLEHYLLNRKYHISNIKYWEDPYENYLLKCPLYDEYGERISRITHPTFGQSWTLLPESDAMWRIYSQYKDSDNMGVRIRTTQKKLQSITESIERFNLGHIGPVKYLSQDVIDNELTGDNIPMEEYWDKVTESLFTKRMFLFISS